MDDDDLRRRIEVLEAMVARWGSATSTPEPGHGARHEPSTADDDPFWALAALKQHAPHAPGAVVYAGHVDLPTGEHYEWQIGRVVPDLLEQDWIELTSVLAALAHPIRLQLLRWVLNGVRTTAELAEQEGLGTTGQLYHHLRQLIGAGWLSSTARGTYRVPPERVVPLLVIMSGARR